MRWTGCSGGHRFFLEKHVARLSKPPRRWTSPTFASFSLKQPAVQYLFARPRNSSNNDNNNNNSSSNGSRSKAMMERVRYIGFDDSVSTAFVHVGKKK